MRRKIITIPRGTFNSLDMNWDIDWRGQSSGEGGTGITQVVHNSFPRWVGSPTIFTHSDGLLQWRAIRASARGRANLYVVEMVDPMGFDLEAMGSPYLVTGVPHSTGQFFTTGYGYSFEPFFSCAAGASKGDTKLTVQVDAETPIPIVGQIVSFDVRPFMITAVDDLGGSEYALMTEPPFRSDMPPNSLIDLRARGVFEAVDPNAGSPAYDANRYSRPALQFVEYLNR